MRHYFWFSSELDACEALCHLGSEGFQGHATPKGDRWLAIVFHREVRRSLAALSERFHRLARTYRGEYGGCEVTPRHSSGPRLSL